MQMLVSVEQQAVWMVSWPSSPLENPCTRVCAKAASVVSTLWDPVDCSPPGSSGSMNSPSIKPMSLMSPALAGDSLPLAPPGKPCPLPEPPQSTCYPHSLSFNSLCPCRRGWGNQRMRKEKNVEKTLRYGCIRLSWRRWYVHSTC